MTQKQRIIIKAEDKTDSIRSWQQNGDMVDITYYNGKMYSYAAHNIRFVDSALAKPDAKNCFEYLTRIAHAVGLKDTEGNNILANRYGKIDFVSEDSMLSAFLFGNLKMDRTDHADTTVYPFGFNISQKQAVDNALSSTLSVIEGPPGTGKTQTILNIIANAVMHNESVAVVSSNNSATANVLEKLKKHNVDFIAAYLGNSDNKRGFIESQKPLPNFSSWKLSPEREAAVRQKLQTLFVLLNDMLVKKNKLSRLKQELDGIELEYKHFIEYHHKSNVSVDIQLKESVTANTVLHLWLICEYAVAVHVPLKMIIRDTSKLNDPEAQYAMNSLTHVDFLIFDKLGRVPRLIVEVDGADYHKEGTRQAERDKLKNGILQKYDLPIIRCRTNESGERQRIINALKIQK
ncbi:hypothetical protein AGMMS50267_09140 [Spirochaetia bacterium]|nr:hypothetical protein AGMMS50267_09140 [Spirochaetia bacterium]